MCLAAVKYYTGDLDSALILIRNVPESVSYIHQPSALAYAARIYLRAGYPDSAFMYAHRLIKHSSKINKETGYQVLLSPEIIGRISVDSLKQYIWEYSAHIEDVFDESEHQLALEQQNIYNYQLHEREKNKVQKDNALFRHWFQIGIVLIVAMLGGVFYLRNRNIRNVHKLHQAIESIDLLKIRINELNKQNVKSEVRIAGFSENKDISLEVKPSLPKPKENTEELREYLKNKLLQLSETSKRKSISSSILNSKVYEDIQKKIEEKKILNENDEVWRELEKIVHMSSPNFISNLRLLTLGNLTSIDLRTALLVKCGIKPSQMTVLLGRSNGAIVSRRESLCVKIFGKNEGVKMIDNIIRLL